MSAEIAIGSKVEQVLIQGDLSKLTPDERVSYYKAVCDSVGLNPLTKPFDYLSLNGKTVLYAKRDATDQLRKIHGVSVRITARETIDGVYVVTAQAMDKAGRTDESTGAVTVASLKGDALANAFMKAETKAKRRVTLSICGLGLLDETEVETIPDARVHVEQPKQLPARGGQHDPAPAETGDPKLYGELNAALGDCQAKQDADVVADIIRAKKDRLSPTQLNNLRRRYGEVVAKPAVVATVPPSDPDLVNEDIPY